MIEVNLPFPKIKLKGKYENLTLNTYRNAHHQPLNNAKSAYKDVVYKNLLPYRKARLERVKITYTIYFKDMRRRDTANFLSVVDKFFSDVLVDMKILKDDSFQFVGEIVYKYGGQGESLVNIKVEEIS